jgi:ketosteroid isomerase-like protein
MSQENLELVREGFARWNEGDYDFFFNSAAPDIELLSRFGSLTGEPYRVHEGVRGWLADIQQSSALRPWRDDLRDLGDEVLAIGGITMRAGEAGST